jgi:hypothetical protein
MLAYVPIRLLIVSLAVVLLTSCASPAPSPTAIPAPTSTSSLAPTLTPNSSAYWPTQGWRTCTPEQQGIDSEQLVKLVVCGFSGKSGDVLLAIMAGQETWDQAIVDRFLRSIR